MKSSQASRTVRQRERRRLRVNGIVYPVNSHRMKIGRSVDELNIVSKLVDNAVIPQRATFGDTSLERRPVRPRHVDESARLSMLSMAAKPQAIAGTVRREPAVITAPYNDAFGLGFCRLWLRHCPCSPPCAIRASSACCPASSCPKKPQHESMCSPFSSSRM